MFVHQFQNKLQDHQITELSMCDRQDIIDYIHKHMSHTNKPRHIERACHGISKDITPEDFVKHCTKISYIDDSADDRINEIKDLISYLKK